MLIVQYNFLITRPKIKEALNAFDTIRQHLQCEGMNIDAFFRLEKQLRESMQNNIEQTAIVHCGISRDWNNVVYN